MYLFFVRLEASLCGSFIITEITRIPDYIRAYTMMMKYQTSNQCLVNCILTTKKDSLNNLPKRQKIENISIWIQLKVKNKFSDDYKRICTANNCIYVVVSFSHISLKFQFQLNCYAKIIINAVQAPEGSFFF